MYDLGPDSGPSGPSSGPGPGPGPGLGPGWPFKGLTPRVAVIRKPGDKKSSTQKAEKNSTIDIQ